MITGLPICDGGTRKGADEIRLPPKLYRSSSGMFATVQTYDHRSRYAHPLYPPSTDQSVALVCRCGFADLDLRSVDPVKREATADNEALPGSCQP
jgi:hypothetical protein